MDGAGPSPAQWPRAPRGSPRGFAENLQDRHFRQGACRHQAALAATLDGSFFGHFREDLFEDLALRTLDGERARKVALGVARMGGQMRENRFARKGGAGGLSGLFGQAVLDFTNP
jgi:hypothetical protein